MLSNLSRTHIIIQLARTIQTNYKGKKQIRNLQDWIGAIAAEILNGEDGIDGLFTKHEPNEPAARNPQIKSSQGIDSRKREKTGLVRKTVQEVIVGAKSEEIMDALNWSAFKDRPLPAEKRYHY